MRGDGSRAQHGSSRELQPEPLGYADFVKYLLVGIGSQPQPAKLEDILATFPLELADECQLLAGRYGYDCTTTLELWIENFVKRELVLSGHAKFVGYGYGLELTNRGGEWLEAILEEHEAGRQPVTYLPSLLGNLAAQQTTES